MSQYARLIQVDNEHQRKRMRVIDLIHNSEKTAFSFEILPPLKGTGIEKLYQTVDTLREFDPKYINITTHRSEYVYKDLGNGLFQRNRLRRRPGTVAVAAAIQNKYNITVVPHILCSGFTREETEYVLLDLQFLNITDLLVLRGDKAKHESVFTPEGDGYHHAIELQEQINNFNLETTVAELKQKLGDDRVILGLSGGVDSTVAAMLLHRAVGKNLTCIFVDNGLLRKDEYKTVLENYKELGLNVVGAESGDLFLGRLAGVTEPEKKRKIIGSTFIDVFDQEASKIEDAKWLGQGTIYPDVIESLSVNGPSQTIKSHHNVGGLPDYMKLKLVEPLRLLFKDEVRRVGKSLGLPDKFLQRHPFPGPGLAIRILGEITPEKVRLLQEADHIFISMLQEEGLYNKVWQAGVMLLPVQSVGVMGDERTYESVVALRAVESTDGMTADWCHLPYEFLARVSNRIINNVRGINRVVYDISSKPPATIEWE